MEPPRDISFSRPLDQAFSWTRTVLFDPFRIERWFVLGFAAFLYLLGRGGGGFNCNLPSGPGGGPGAGAAAGADRSIRQADRSGRCRSSRSCWRSSWRSP